MRIIGLTRLVFGLIRWKPPRTVFPSRILRLRYNKARFPSLRTHRDSASFQQSGVELEFVERGEL